MDGSKRLLRNRAAGRIAGVCAGIADFLEVDVTLVRLAWVVLSIVPGGFVGGLLVYLAAWMIMPISIESATVASSARHLTRSQHDWKIAGVCGGISEYFRIDSTAVRLLWVILAVVPGCIVFGVLAYLVAWFVMPIDRGSQVTPATAAA